MRWIVKLLAVAAIGVGLTILIKVGDTMWVSGVRSYETPTGETVWIPQGRDGYTTMIFLSLLFLIFPLVGFAIAPKKRR